MNLQWCHGEPNNFAPSQILNASLAWTYEGCVSLNTNGNSFCLLDIPCRASESDGDSGYSYIMCQYSLTNSVLVNLPPSSNTLEDDFFLHDNEILISNNQLYKLQLWKGNLHISIAANNSKIWETDVFYPSTFYGFYTLSMEWNGNLVIQDSLKNITWKSNTAQSNTSLAPYKLQMEDEGYISITNGLGLIIWASDKRIQISSSPELAAKIDYWSQWYNLNNNINNN
jgi:hypothetical protein